MFGEDVIGGGERVLRRVPHYAQKTIISSAPEFANTEQDVIRQSFSTGNHTWMKESLPVELGPDAVNMLRRKRMERNREAEPLPQTWSKMTQLWGGGYYQEFEYIPDPYDHKMNFERQLRNQAIERREKISHHDWRYSSQEKRLKHETMIKDPRNKETYPYLGGDKDTELQSSKHFLRNGAFSGWDWSQESAQQSTEVSFLAGKGSGLEDGSRMSRMTLPLIVQRLQKRLDVDWEGTTVVVSATDQDLIQIAFHMATVDSERGVAAYMNVLSKDVELLGSLGVRKVSQLWGMRRDFSNEMGSKSENDGGSTDGSEAALEHVWTFFLLMPKWVRMRPTDAHYTVHPRANGSAFRMSTAGSSVLLSLGSSVLDPTEAVRRKNEASSGSGLPSARGAKSAPTEDESRKPDFKDMNLLQAAVSALPSIRETFRP
mmetsp:Transcript_128659/g.223042  ORF Transcript_128659/g.223042 Transcript_128659/m.223042 type:complete len:430 (-) Transcript_128659:66-1355(-)